MRVFILVSLILFAFFNLFSQETKQQPSEIIALFEANLDTINDYTCVLHDFVKKGKSESDNYWTYKFLKPKYIRMESFKGDRVGSKAFYDYITKKVTGRQGGILSVIKLTLDLSSPLVKNKRGTTIAESDWLFILQRTKNILNEPNVVSSVSKTKYKNCDVIMLYMNNFPAEKYNFDETRMFFDENYNLIGIFYYENGELVQDVNYSDIKLNRGIVIDSMYVK